MARISFYLRDNNAKRKTSVQAILTDNTQRYKFSTGQTIHPRHWHEKKQRAKSSLPGQRSFNDLLELLEVDLLEAYAKLRSTGAKITGTSLKDAIKPPEVRDQKNAFWQAFDSFMLEAQGTKAANTLGTYRTCLFHLEGYAKHTKRKLTFEDINERFESAFVSYMVNQRKAAQSTIAKQFAVLKTFMEWTRAKGLHENLAYKTIVQREAPSPKVSLSEAELAQLEQADLSSRPALERVRDMFLFCCETSLRYSDLANLKPVNLVQVRHGNHLVKCLKLAMVKTRGGVTQPLSEKALALLEKYADRNRRTCFPIISGQRMNDYIKEAAKVAGIETPVQVVRHIGSTREETTSPKHELLTMHTARRTFVTTHINWGWTDEQIMVYTGHKSSKEIQTYRDNSDENLIATAMNAPRPGKIRMQKAS